MTDQPVPGRDEPEPDETDELAGASDGGTPPVRPSNADVGEETGGPRPPRPSQAEGERGLTDG
ncbi:MAG: hypothetical protein M3Y29_08115 [Chloroflexota bacterium]|nr:hypothetical protein [Chloroflexota bacterium]